MASDSVVLTSAAQMKKSAHFWVSSYPFFQSSLFFAPAPSGAEPAEVYLQLYDPDGMVFNELTVQPQFGSVGIVEMEPLLGACKLESGFKHAHLVVQSTNLVRAWTRIHGNISATLQSEPAEVSLHHTSFLPITLGEERTSLVALVNQSESAQNIRLRLYFGKRLPEVQVSIAARGARLVNIPVEFGEYLPRDGRSYPAYIRISSVSDRPCGVQLVEVIKTEKEGNIFASVS